MRYAKAAPQSSLPGISAGGTTRFEGVVDRIYFPKYGQTSDSGFAIVVLVAHGQRLKVKGTFGTVKEGETYRCDGTVSRDDYGEVMTAAVVTPVVPETADGLATYLESFDGVGPVLARRLLKTLGMNAIQRLEDDPAACARLVAGLSPDKASAISTDLKSRRAERDVYVFLHGIGLSTAMAKRVFAHFGEKAIGVVKENPYKLVQVSGIGFAKADEWALKMGIARDAEIRREAALLHVLGEATDEGHCYLPRDVLFGSTRELVGDVDLAGALETMERERQLVTEGDAVFLARIHRAEVEIAERIADLQRLRRPAPAIPTGGLLATQLAALSDEQRAAVEMTVRDAVSVITGGPGSGKTTSMKSVVTLWREAGKTVLLCAPTGKAAKKLSQATGRDAKTIHRTLEWQPDGGPGRNRDNPLDADLVIVDESSMGDVSIVRNLLNAVPNGASVLFVGDVDQLPSVGPGQVLHDLIESGEVRVARLTRIFRQAAGSQISEQARRINAGYAPDAGAEVEIVEIPQGEGAGGLAQKEIVRLVVSDLPARFDVRPDDVKVITPMNADRQSSREELNRALQYALNPDGPSINRGKAPPLRLGDSVMQKRNDYTKGVFNGDEGRIVACDPSARKLTVDFDGQRIDYKSDEIGDLELCRAITVHKSQGAEFPIVVVCCLGEHFRLLKRNLLYTAITRAKRHVVLVAQTRALWMAAKTPDTSVRFTRLADRLRGESPDAPRVEPIVADDADDLPEWMEARPIEAPTDDHEPVSRIDDAPIAPLPPAWQAVADAAIDEVRAAHALRAMRALAGMDDGARSRDGAGFNRYDTDRGRDLARNGIRNATDLAWAIRKARFYRGQLGADVLSALGIDG